MGVLGIALLAAVIELWPIVIEPLPAAGPARVAAERRIHSAGLLFGRLDVSVNRETAVIVLVVIASALGSFIHAATSFVDYVGNRRLVTSWLWWYVLRLTIGSALGLLFYFAVRGGFFSADASAADVNPYGVAALAGLAGLFSKQATDKLRELFETLFRVAPGEGDDRRRDSLANPIPTITALQPTDARVGSGALALAVAGHDFVRRSVVRVDGAPVPTTYVSATRLTTTIAEERLRDEGTLQIAVFNPEPGGGMSEPVALRIAAAADEAAPVAPAAPQRR